MSQLEQQLAGERANSQELAAMCEQLMTQVEALSKGK